MYVLFFMSSPKKSPCVPVLTWFLILDKIQDGDHCWWRDNPPAAPPPIKIPHLVKNTEGKIVSKCGNIIIKNPGKGFHPSPPLVPCMILPRICIQSEVTWDSKYAISELSASLVSERVSCVTYRERFFKDFYCVSDVILTDRSWCRR